jgi:hypothetical protein
MSAAGQTELAAIAATQSAVDAMAVVTLSPEKYAAEVYEPFKTKLVSAIDSVRAVDYDITTTAGMATAVKCRALFRDMRIAADKERKARKEPITKIGKLLESGFDLVEERITPLELMFDADIDAENARKEVEKAAKIAAERARTEAIDAMILKIACQPATLAGKASVEIQAWLDAENPDKDFDFMEFSDKAADAIAESLIVINEMLGKVRESEAAALAAEESRVAELARLEAQRVENARVAAENERIANEQAKERQRLAALAAAQALAAKELADKAAANLKAERDAQELAMRLDREKAAAEQAKANAEIKAAQEALAASQAAHAAALAKQAAAVQYESDHAEALAMNAEFDAALARIPEVTPEPFADLARCTAMATQHLADALHSDHADALDELAELTNEEIIAFGAEVGLPVGELVERLERFTVWARAELLV